MTDITQNGEIDPPPRPNGRPHLSECILMTAYQMQWADRSEFDCTCDDYSPEWTND